MKRILTHNLKRSAEKYPDHIAFKQLKTKISYRDLMSKANQVARYLLSIGVKKGDRVGVFMNRSIESCYTIYGIMLSGAAYVPIDTNLPNHRIFTIIEDCSIRILISKNAYKKNIQNLIDQKLDIKYIVGLNDGHAENITFYSWNSIFALSPLSVDVNISEDDIAYIIYTSGTTGNPKGIVHTHFSGSSYAKLSADLYEVSHTDVLGNHSHLHYDISTMGYLTMVYAGGCTVIVPEAYTLFPSSLVKMIAEEEITIWYSVPLAVIQMLQSGVLPTHNFSNLKWLMYGGESFAYKHIIQLIEQLPHIHISNVYGPAEVNQCTYYNFKKHSIPSQSIPLGQQWPETDIQIIKNQKKDISGELIVASTTQMKEYWNKPEKTKSSFIEREDSLGIKRRYYKTGDIGAYNGNGELIFLGRKDRQIKIRGYRVELNEVETILLQNETIQEAAVYAVKKDGINVIFAHVVANVNEVNQKELKKYLAIKLPIYALPEEFITVKNIPRTLAGKVDYKQLIQ